MTSASTKKIFVIDDDEAILEAMTFCLEDEGYTVQAVRKADTILPLVISFGPQLILLDLFLSGQDGKEVARILKEEEKTKNIPIVMFSAHPAAQQEVKALGIAGFLPKPFNTDELFRVIEEHRLK